MAIKLDFAGLTGPLVEICGAIAGFSTYETVGRLVHLHKHLDGDGAASDNAVAAMLGPRGVQAMLESGLGQRIDATRVLVSLKPAKNPQAVAAGRARVAKAKAAGWSGGALGPLKESSAVPQPTVSGSSADPSANPQRTVSEISAPAENPLKKSSAVGAPLSRGVGGSVSDLGSGTSDPVPLSPLVLRSPTIADPLPGRARKAGGAAAGGAEGAAAQRLWDLQTRLRKEVIPGCRELQASPERLDRVVKRLRAGNSEEACAAVLRSVADRVKRDPAAAEWFNGVTNWRPDNFDRELGKLGAAIGGGDRRGPTGFDHISNSLTEMRDRALAEEAEEGIA